MIRVLIAEDSVTVRELLQAVLSADPEIVIAGTAKNGLEAAEMTKRLQPDVVTMDINMPVMNGFEATKQLMIEMPNPVVTISTRGAGRGGGGPTTDGERGGERG